MRLYGRDAELAALDELLARARAGGSGALVLRGDPGIGKSALLAELTERASDFRTIIATAIDEESEIPYAGLHLLLRSVLDRVDLLPDVQAEALRGALGLAKSGPPDRFLVGLAVLSLLAEAAAGRPLLCVADDAHWLDRSSADALLFAARRLGSESVVLVFSARTGGFPAAGLLELHLAGLSEASASALLGSVAADTGLTTQARRRVLAEAGGNPLALLELPKVAAASADPAIVAGVAAQGTLPLTDRLRNAFSSQLADLPELTRTLLLVAAAEGTGDLAAILRAGAAFGTTLADLDPARAAGLVEVNGRLAFRHSLIRAAAEHIAPLALRRSAHQALADALDAPEAADRRAWHRAAAAQGPGEQIAAELERTADSARERGGEAAALVWYERAAQLSTDSAAKARRLSLASEAASEAGDLDRAAALAGQGLRLVGPVTSVAEPTAAAPSAAGSSPAAQPPAPAAGPAAAEPPAPAAAGSASPSPRAAVTARLLQVEGAVAFLRGDPDTAYLRYVRASELADEQRKPALILEAVHAAWYAGEEQLAESVARLERLDLAAAPLARLALSALAPVLGRPAAGLDAGETLTAVSGSVSDQVLICGLALVLGQDSATRQIGAALSQELRATGRIGWLPSVLFYVSSAQAFSGRLDEAHQTATEAVRLARDTRQQRWVDALSEPLALLAAAQGDAKGCHELADEALSRSSRPAWTAPWTSAALGLLDLGLGAAESALARLETLAEGRRFFHIAATRSTPDLVEAAVRLGRPEATAEPLTLFETWSRNTGQAWTAALVLRCRALLGGDEEDFRRALALHEREDRPFDQARTQLLYGERLRREKRKSDARVQLGSAVETFERLGAVPWADRARGELVATGTSARPARPGPAAGLTPQELQIVRLAAKGLSNKDIAAQLFLSPRTVGAHLYKAYPKLGVLSRAELRGLDLG